MLGLGTRVEFANEIGRIVARTFEPEPKYDVMLASGSIRAYLTATDFTVLPALSKSHPVQG
jgi:hypothetical protein